MLIEAERTKKSNLYYTFGITPKCVTSCGAHLRSIAPGQRRNVEAVAIEKAAGDSVRLTGPESNRRFATLIAMSLTASPRNSQKPIDNKVWERQSCKRADHGCQRAEDVGPDLNPIFQARTRPEPKFKFINQSEPDLSPISQTPH